MYTYYCYNLFQTCKKLHFSFKPSIFKEYIHNSIGVIKTLLVL